MLVRHHGFSVTTGSKGKTDHAAHQIALGQRGYTGTHSLHHARHVVTGRPGQLVLVLSCSPAKTGPGLGIDGVDPRKADAHPHFAIGRHLVERGVELEYRGVAECGNL